MQHLCPLPGSRPYRSVVGILAGCGKAVLGCGEGDQDLSHLHALAAHAVAAVEERAHRIVVGSAGSRDQGIDP